MIPKQVFFIWMGDNKPNYVDFSFNMFKKVNPDFKIDLIHFTDDDVNKSKQYEGVILKYVKKEHIDNTINFTNNIRYVSSYKNKDNAYKVKLSDHLRYAIVGKYGGIYLDCDTFPIKPFDNSLLNYHKFLCTLRGDKPDAFFYGLDPKCKEKSPLVLLPTSSLFWNNLSKDKKYMELCKKFYDCTLNYGEHYNSNEHYIDHYWQRKFKYYDT